jgi:hypothetical protein
MMTVPAPPGRRKRLARSSAVEPDTTAGVSRASQRINPAARAVGRVGRSAGVPVGVAELSKGIGGRVGNGGPRGRGGCPRPQAATFPEPGAVHRLVRAGADRCGDGEGHPEAVPR